MAIEALPAGHLRFDLGERKDLGDVAAGFDVFLARSMTGFATLPGRTTTRVQRGLKVRRAPKCLELFFVAGLALLGTGELRRVGTASVRFLLSGGRTGRFLILGDNDATRH